MTERFSITREHWDGTETRKNFKLVDLTEKNKKNRIQDLDNFTSVEYEFNSLDKQFLPALEDMKTTAGAGESYLGQISTAIQDHDTDLTGFITELLQNALDYGSSKIRIAVKKSSIELEHNGKTPHHGINLPFIYREVDGLTGIHSTQKNADPRFIGTFGLGFKYWTQFFETCEISGIIKQEGSMETTSLFFNRKFNPHLVTLYGTKSDDGSDYSTRFKFDGFIEGEIDTSINILNDRFTKSLSVLPRGAEFRLEIITDKGSHTYDTSTKKFEVEELGLYDLELVTVTDANNSTLKFINANSTIKQLVNNHFNDDEKLTFYNTAKDYVSQLSGGQILERIGGEKNYIQYLNEAKVKISLPIEDTSSLGYCSSLFITPDTRLPISGIFDSVWRLHSHRRSLDLQENKNFAKEWNEMISSLMCKMYDDFLLGIVGSSNELGISKNMLFRYLNPQLVEDEKWVSGWNNDNSILSLLHVTESGVIIGNRKPSPNLLKLWNHTLNYVMEAEKDGREQMMKNATQTISWLSEALDPNVAHVVLSDGVKLPVSVSGEYWVSANFPEINHNLASGIPDLFLEDCREEDAESPDNDKSWVKCFDYVIEDPFGNTKFADEQDTNQVLWRDNQDADELIDAFNDLSQIHKQGINASYSLATKEKQVRWIYTSKKDFPDDSRNLKKKFISPGKWLLQKFRQLHTLSVESILTTIDSLKPILENNLNKLILDQIIVSKDPDSKNGYNVLILPDEGAVWAINSYPKRYMSLSLSDLQQNRINYHNQKNSAEHGFLKWGEKEKIGVVDLDGKLSKLLLNFEEPTLEKPMCWKNLVSMDDLKDETNWVMWVDEPSKVKILDVNIPTLINEASVFKRILPVFVDSIGTMAPDTSKPYIHKSSLRQVVGKKLNEIVLQHHKSDVELLRSYQSDFEYELMLSSIVGNKSKFDFSQETFKISEFSAPNRVPQIFGSKSGMSSHSVIRATGILPFLSERIGTLNETEDRALVTSIKRLSKYYSELPHKTDTFEKLLRLRRVWDIFWYKENSGYISNDELRLKCKLIPKPGVVNNSYVGNNGTPRDTGSMHYDDFRNFGLIHFQKERHIFPEQIEDRNRLAKLFDNKEWLPYFDVDGMYDSETKFLSACGIIMIPVYDKEILQGLIKPTTQAGHDKTDALRPALSKLVSIVKHSFDTDNLDLLLASMKILEHLFEFGLSTGSWFKTSEGDRNRNNIFYLKQAFEKIEEKENFHNLNRELSVNLNEWNEFTQQALKPNFDIEKHSKLAVPKLVEEEGHWIVSQTDSVPISDIIAEKENYAVLNLEFHNDERIPKDLISVPEGYTIIAFYIDKTNTKFGSKFLSNIIRPLETLGVNCLSLENEMSNIPDDATEAEEIIPPYFDSIVRNKTEDREIDLKIYQMENPKVIDAPTSGDLLPSIENKNGILTWVNPLIHPNTREEHLWVSRIVESTLKRFDITLKDKEKSSTGLVLEMSDMPEERSKFTSVHIPAIGNLDDLKNKFKQLDKQKKLDEAGRRLECEKLLEFIKQAHLHTDQTILTNSMKLLSEESDDFLYEEIPALNKSQISSATTMSKQVQISLHNNPKQWMLKDFKVKDASSIPTDILTVSAGCVLVCNEIEVNYLRLMHDDDNRSAANFSLDILETLKEAIIENWWAVDDFIEVDDALYQEESDKYKFTDIRLHKHHAALIWGFLASIIESD